MQHLNIRISGKVQGVWYRKSAQLKALELGLKGFIQNEPDGSVYAEVEGEAPVLQTFVDWCWEGPPLANVESVKVIPTQVIGFQQFEVRR